MLDFKYVLAYSNSFVNAKDINIFQDIIFEQIKMHYLLTLTNTVFKLQNCQRSTIPLSKFHK